MFEKVGDTSTVTAFCQARATTLGREWGHTGIDWNSCSYSVPSSEGMPSNTEATMFMYNK